MLNSQFTLLRTGALSAKALQAELDKLGAAYKCGRCDDPDGGAQTFFYFFYPAGAEPPTTCAVLFHGTGNDALFCWEDLILDLLRSGRAVFCFDLPGHGQNSTTILNEESFARTASFLDKLLPELLPALTSCEAIGYSLGGLAAVRTVTESRLPWQKLILLAIPERVELRPAFLLQEALSFFRPGFWRQVVRYGWDAAFPAFGAIRRARFPIRLADGIEVAYPRFVDALLRKTDMSGALRKLRMPVLLIYGGCDRLAGGAYGRTLPGTFQVISGATHFLLPFAAKTRALLLDWLLTSPQRPAGNSTLQ